MAYDSVLTALADPTRRELYVSLRRGDRTVSELASLTRISQPATSQHLRVLREAELVTETPRRHAALLPREHRRSRAAAFVHRIVMGRRARGVCGRRPGATAARCAQENPKEDQEQENVMTLPPIRRSVSVSWDPAAAFRRFTADFGTWWPGRTTLGRRPARAPHRLRAARRRVHLRRARRRPAVSMGRD